MVILDCKAELPEDTQISVKRTRERYIIYIFIVIYILCIIIYGWMDRSIDNSSWKKCEDVSKRATWSRSFHSSKSSKFRILVTSCHPEDHGDWTNTSIPLDISPADSNSDRQYRLPTIPRYREALVFLASNSSCGRHDVVLYQPLQLALDL